jgi:hypothetical protein
MNTNTPARTNRSAKNPVFAAGAADARRAGKSAKELFSSTCSEAVAAASSTWDEGAPVGWTTAMVKRSGSGCFGVSEAVEALPAASTRSREKKKVKWYPIQAASYELVFHFACAAPYLSWHPFQGQLAGEEQGLGRSRL